MTNAIQEDYLHSSHTHQYSEEAFFPNLTKWKVKDLSLDGGCNPLSYGLLLNYERLSR